MKTLFIFILISIGTNAWSKGEASNDFSRSSSEVKALSADDLAYRFHVTGKIFILSQDGDKLINMASESREWQFSSSIEKPMESNWRFQQKGLPVVALKQKWTLGKDGKVSVEIAQYDDIERSKGSGIKYGKLIKEEKITLKNFAPIDWTIPAGSKKLVVRLTPGILQNTEAVDISSLPISGKNIVIFDKTGKLWADQVTADHPSLYFGVTTHQGSLFLSFMPFKGSKLVGEANGGRIKIKNGKDEIYLQSETPFLPEDIRANIYGSIKPETRSDRLNSVRTYSSDKEEEFLKVSGSR